jgi:hypothetical protein
LLLLLLLEVEVVSIKGFASVGVADTVSLIDDLKLVLLLLLLDKLWLGLICTNSESHQSKDGASSMIGGLDVEVVVVVVVVVVEEVELGLVGGV